jgi:hypothetical protein
MYLCQGSDGVVQGSYGAIGVLQGVVSGNTFTGAWYDAGEGSATMSSHGEVTFTMYHGSGGAGDWITGVWTYGFGADAVAGGSVWTDVRTNTTMPTAKQCFSSEVAGRSLASGAAAESSVPVAWDRGLSGRFNVLAGDPPAVFDVCPSSDGSTVASYTWILAGNTGAYTLCVCACVMCLGVGGLVRG